MTEIIFIYNTLPVSIQCDKNELMREIFQRFANKVKIDLSEVYFLYGGGQIQDINQKFNDILKDYDKNLNSFKILVYSYENKNENNNLEIIKEIICGKCRNICLINFNKYKINISGCINNHYINNITLDEFLNLQKIDSSKIICNDCKSHNKRNSNNFYKCLNCEKDICPSSMIQNHKEHDIIEYDKINYIKNYICNLHNETFISFCKKCNKNLCKFCDSEHKDKENIIYYKDELPKNDMMKNQIEEMKNNINIFKKKIKEIKNILDSIITNLEIYYSINDNMIKKFENKNRNFQLFKNMNEIINNNFNILEDLNVIKNENDKIKFLSYTFKIYEEMNDKNINNNLGKNLNSNKEIKNSENHIKIENNEKRKKEMLINQEMSDNNFFLKKLEELNNKIIKENKNNSKLELLIDKINKDDKNLNSAKIVEAENRYDDAFNFLENEFKKRTSDFNRKERNKISEICKDIVSNQKSSLKKIVTYEAKEKKKDNPYYLKYIIEYKNKVFEELNKNCRRVINNIDEYLLKIAKDDEAIVFYYKIKGDFNRYIAKYSEGKIKMKAENSATKAYTEAIKKSSKLNALNQVRLELFLYYSVFLYEMLNDKIKAIDIAKKAIREADKELSNIDKNIDKNKYIFDPYNLLKENVTTWENEE